MKKCRYFLFSTLLILSLTAFYSCDTASNVEDPDTHYFVKYYGGDGNQYGVDMLTLGDGSFLLLGKYSVSDFEVYVYLVRVDAEGEIIWEKRYGVGDVTSNAKDLERSGDGNFIVLSDETPIAGYTSLKLRKISPDGVMLDSVHFGTKIDQGTSTHDIGRSVTSLNDGGFIVSGTTQLTEQWSSTSPGLDPGDTFNYRFDSNLNLMGNEWSPVIHGFGAIEGSQLDVAVKILPTGSTSGDMFYVFGYTNSNLDNTNPNKRLGLFYFARDAQGGLGTAYYPGNIVNVDDTEINYVQGVPPEMGTGFITVGTSRNNVGVSNIFFARFRSQLSYVPNDASLYITISSQPNTRGVSGAVSLTGELGYLILGNEVRSTTALNIWLAKIDQSGRVLWSTTLGSEAKDDSGAAVAELPDGKIVVLGTMGLADDQFKMALFKMNPRGQLLK